MTSRSTNSFPGRTHRASETIDDSIGKVIAGWTTTRPDLQVQPIAITARLARLHAALGPKLESVFERFGIRGADFAVIATLVRLGEPRVSQRRLGSELGLSPGTISVRVDRLTRRGLVRRDGDPEDGRGAALSLTDAGLDLFEACAPEHLANAQALLEGLDERERDHLGQLLSKLLYTLEESGSDDLVTPELGLVVACAPAALQQRRAVGLAPLPGLLVRHVEPGSPAASAGIRPGDLLRTANQRPLRTGHDLRQARDASRGQRRTLVLEITRGAESLRLRVTPASTPPPSALQSRS